MNTKLLLSFNASGAGMSFLLFIFLSFLLILIILRYFTRKLYGVIRRDFRKHLQAISVFARVIQRHWRGYAARKRVTAMRARIRTAAHVQSAVRGWLARRAYATKQRKTKAARARIAQVEGECAALRTQMSNLNKYVLALAALVKQSSPATNRPTSPAAPQYPASPDIKHAVKE